MRLPEDHQTERLVRVAPAEHLSPAVLTRLLIDEGLQRHEAQYPDMATD